jgi:uncharacterized protein (TIGR00645 family)
MEAELEKRLPKFIFASRWLQAPLYFGLMVVLAVYVYEFALSLGRLVMQASKLSETAIMLSALDLIDVVMIANLLIMVIIGGYETFVSRLHLRSHPDNPDWLDEVNAGTLKVKLALSLISISSIHLLRTFIDPSQYDNFAIMWQVIIHLTLVVSAVCIALSNKLIGHHSVAK